jgi:cysteine-rich repeat protein
MRCSLTLGGAKLFLILLVGLLSVSCGGKVDLNFVGAPSGSGGTGGTGTMVSATCGDGVIDQGKECDDGNTVSGDGCSAECKIEPGWTCTGEPSICSKCGNGVLEAGEECDDGNTVSHDGCSADCKIEGSCKVPLPIPLRANKDGLIGMVSSATSPGEPGQVDAAVCEGTAKVGSGPDRIFELELPNAADLDVRVGSSFDAIVRLTTAPCDLKTELPGGCVQGAGVAGIEHAQQLNAPAGKYYVVVKGRTSKQSGDFSVNVEARCPLDSLKIDHVILAEPFRTAILNTNQQCAIDLSRVGIYAQPEAADIPKTLPAISLEPLQRRLLTSESPPPANTTYQGKIRFDLEKYAGAYYLCRGACDTANGENVIDAFRWQGEMGALSVGAPQALKFDKDAPALTDRTTMSYYRVLGDSVFPNFSGNDFSGAYFVETFEDGSLSAWEAPTALFYKPKFEKLTGTIGAFSLALVGGNADMAVWNGPNHLFRDNAGATLKVAPTYVSLRVRGSDKTLNHGWAFFGRQGAETEGFGSFFRDGGTLGFGAPMPAIVVPYQIETWYLIEYKDFAYPPVVGGMPGSFGVYIDGKSKGTVPLSIQNISQISLRSLGDTTFWVDQIIVR